MPIPAPERDSVFPFVRKMFRLTRRTQSSSLANKCKTDLLFNGAKVYFRIRALQLTVSMDCRASHKSVPFCFYIRQRNHQKICVSPCH